MKGLRPVPVWKFNHRTRANAEKAVIQLPADDEWSLMHGARIQVGDFTYTYRK